MYVSKSKTWTIYVHNKVVIHGMLIKKWLYFGINILKIYRVKDFVPIFYKRKISNAELWNKSKLTKDNNLEILFVWFLY